MMHGGAMGGHPKKMPAMPKMPMMESRMPKGRKILERMMREVHMDTPSTVTRADVSGPRKEAMLRAIAYSKARKAGAKIKGRMSGMGM